MRRLSSRVEHTAGTSCVYGINLTDVIEPDKISGEFLPLEFRGFRYVEADSDATPREIIRKSFEKEGLSPDLIDLCIRIIESNKPDLSEIVQEVEGAIKVPYPVFQEVTTSFITPRKLSKRAYEEQQKYIIQLPPEFQILTDMHRREYWEVSYDLYNKYGKKFLRKKRKDSQQEAMNFVYHIRQSPYVQNVKVKRFIEFSKEIPIT